MNVTINHPSSSFTGTITVLETVAVGFTNGVASVDIPPQAISVFGSMPGFSYTYGAPTPAPPYDANLDTSVNAIVGNTSSATAGALRAAYGTSVSLGAAVGDGATDDTAAINGILSGASSRAVVRGIPGKNYLISAPLVVQSGTTLDLTGCTVTLKAGANCNMLQNAAVTAVRTISDAAMTSGSATLTSATANFTSADVGRTVAVAGALATNTPLTANITAVTNATTATLALSAAVTVSAAGASIYNRDANITIRGGDWRGGSNGGSNLNAHYLRLRHIDGLVVRDLSVTNNGGKYAVALGDVTDFLVENCTFPTTASDGVHVNGPAARGRIVSIHGTTGDDMVALTANDYVAYSSEAAGDITDCVISGVYPNGSVEGVKVLGGLGCKVRSVTIDNVYGSTSTAFGVVVGDDGSSASTLGSDIDGVFIRNVRVSCPSGYAVVQLSPRTGGAFVIDGVNVADTTSGGVVVANTTNGTTIKSLTISNLTCNTGTGQKMIATNSGVTVETLTVEKARVSLQDSTHGYLLNLNGTITVLNVDNCTCLAGQAMIYVTGTLSYLNLHGAYSTAQYTMYNAGSTAIDATARDTFYATSGSTFAIATGSGGITLRGGGIRGGTGATMLTRGSTQTLRVIGLDINADLSKLTKTAGDMCNNVNAGLTPVSGTAAGLVGPCVCDGTNWHNLASGSTY